MIEVEINIDGLVAASAEAEDPEAALLAARTLYDETVLGARFYFAPRVDFRVDGSLVRSLVGRP